MSSSASPITVNDFQALRQDALELSAPQNPIVRTPGAVLTVLASDHDEADYIRNDADWLAELHA